jgi:putative salt-induced outer membrane protein
VESVAVVSAPAANSERSNPAPQMLACRPSDRFSADQNRFFCFFRLCCAGCAFAVLTPRKIPHYYYTERRKTMRILKLSILFLFMMAAVQISEAAEETEPQAEKRFSNEFSFSLVNTTGNSDTLALAGINEMKYKFTDKWSASWVVGALYSESDGDKDAERYFTDLRADYAFTDRWYAYGLGSWLRDEFAGFDNRVSIGPGVGYKFLIGPKHFLLSEGGLNYAYEDYTDPDEDNEQFLEGRLFGKYEWAFTEKTKFSQSLEYLQGFNDGSMWKLNSETALVTLITDILALKVSYSIFYNNDPRPSDLDDTDTILATSLVITY